MNNQLDFDRSIELLLMHQQQIHENIKFADQKAIQILTLDGVLLGILFNEFLDKNHINQSMIALFICLILLVGISSAIYVIYPRGNCSFIRGKGVIDSARIIQFSQESFITQCSEISNIALLEELRTFIYDRVTIERSKYKFLRASIAISSVGWIMMILFSGLAKLVL